MSTIEKLSNIIAVIDPIESRADIIALKTCFVSLLETQTPLLAWFHFVYIWALREPVLIQQYVENNYDLRALIGLKIKYQYIPKLLVRFMKPKMLIENWNTIKVYELAHILNAIFADDRDVTMSEYKKITKAFSTFKGIGVYSKEHFFRTACLVKGKRHPSKDFVVMGGGASKQKYKILKELGINNVSDACKKINKDIDAGELAYYLCMGKF